MSVHIHPHMSGNDRLHHFVGNSTEFHVGIRQVHNEDRSISVDIVTLEALQARFDSPGETRACRLEENNQ